MGVLLEPPLEAMACGLPVVASRVGGLTEIICAGFNGFFFNHESPDELCSIIEKTARTEWDRQDIANWTKNRTIAGTSGRTILWSPIMKEKGDR